MKLVAGVDIGNATTETAIARIDGKNVTFLSSGITGTTGIKGTKQNIHGVFQSLKNALDEVGFEISDLDEVRINEAAPVIGDVAMETITETIITESTMIGHNPNTPGGVGIGVGISQRIDRLDTVKDGGDVIVVIPAEVSFEAAAALINRYNKIFNISFTELVTKLCIFCNIQASVVNQNTSLSFLNKLSSLCYLCLLNFQCFSVWHKCFTSYEIFLCLQ